MCFCSTRGAIPSLLNVFLAVHCVLRVSLTQNHSELALSDEAQLQAMPIAHQIEAIIRTMPDPGPRPAARPQTARRHIVHACAIAPCLFVQMQVIIAPGNAGAWLLYGYCDVIL